MTKVLLVADCEKWAWGYRARSLQRYAPQEYDVDVVFNEQYVKDYKRLVAVHDFCFFFSWTSFPKQMVEPWGKRASCMVTCGGVLYDRRDPTDWRSLATSTSRSRKSARERLPLFKTVLVPNSELYASVKKLHQNVVLVPSGVDCETFAVQPCTESQDGRLRVGWCGSRRSPVKGRTEILVPLMARLGSDRFDWRINDRTYENALSREEMVSWYANLDVLISTSSVEGTPSPTFEAALCGQCVLCTRTGVWQDFSAAKTFDCVAPAYHNAQTAEHTIQWFASKLLVLEKNRGHCQTLGTALASAVRQSYDYKELAQKHLEAICGA